MMYKKMFKYFLLLSLFSFLNLSAMHSSEGEDEHQRDDYINDYNSRNLPTTSPLKRSPVIDDEDYEQALIFDESPFKKHASLARNLKQYTPNSNKCDQNGNTRAHFTAAHPQQKKIIKCLFKESRSFNPNKTDLYGRTPLHIAIQENNNNFISEAINDPRTDLIAVNEQDGKSAFDYVFQSNYISFHKDALCLLLIKGIRESRHERYQWFFQKIYGDNQQNLLHLLARYGCSKSIEYILEKGLIFQNDRDLKERTPLMIAAKYKQHDVVKVLIKNQWTQIELCDQNYNDVFDYAFQHCNLFNDSVLSEEQYRDSIVLCIMKECKTRNNSIDLAEWEPSGEYSSGNLLHYCASTGCIESARYLMKKKILDIHDRDRNDDEFKSGKTPLHYAIQYKNLKLVKLFTSYDAFYINQNYDLWKMNLNDALNNYISWSTMEEIENYVRSCLSIIHKLKSGTPLDFITFPH